MALKNSQDKEKNKGIADAFFLHLSAPDAVVLRTSRGDTS